MTALAKHQEAKFIRLQLRQNLVLKAMTAAQWARANDDALTRTRKFLAAMEDSGDLSVAKLMLASSQIQGLA